MSLLTRTRLSLQAWEATRYAAGNVRCVSSTPTPVRLRFFTKDNCMLCHTAKQTMNNAVDATMAPVTVEIVDITHHDNTEWWDKYCYDIPVLHVEGGAKSVIFMHKLFKNKILEAIDEVQNGSNSSPL
ncbi:hypothetical protein PSN45_004886 [Yamadazyma tenuis]|uniref:Glutaredoxin-like protein n=1 Tax=Candida tenuis (strain ATCC 10573 / BCRC 21748 / CBS 615 / JCM 9827 / NBRC 10315 / NRRL Y-1498 / VKM Y-70) TaxID=590646 RepID=G3B1Z7_CANTC|nr:DUF836-domain-containing protein [Yamadazyma tenuis ATCC 10573]EGV64569.1 DUF836-domain-containing protein [Yamadazyma tenuis ATCC 10573]WEJ97336.1 hypothetical protein PSN45_004886 [Yamadazyma tenuis]